MARRHVRNHPGVGARGAVMAGTARKRLAFAFSLLLGLLATPARGQQADPRAQARFLPPLGAVVDGAQPVPGVIQPVVHTTTYPGAVEQQPGAAVPAGASCFGVPQLGPSPEVGLLDNFQFFFGLDGSKSPEDLG